MNTTSNMALILDYWSWSTSWCSFTAYCFV